MRIIIAIIVSAALAQAVKPACPGLDINRSPADSLVRCLPGVGPAMARKIDSVRSVAPIRSCSELGKIPGVGPKKIIPLCAAAGLK